MKLKDALTPAEVDRGALAMRAGRKYRTGGGISGVYADTL
jgi:hypothetical protein